MSDFQSLLTTFQHATKNIEKKPCRAKNSSFSSTKSTKTKDSSFSSTKSTKIKDSSFSSTKSTNNNISDKETPPGKSRKAEAPIKEIIDRHWQACQLQKYMNITTTSEINYNSCDNSSNYKECNKVHVHIAVCCIIVDSFPHEQIWRIWSQTGFEDSSKKKLKLEDGSHVENFDNTVISATADFFVHAKYPERIQSEWVKEKTIAQTFRPNWNDVRVVRAMLATAEKALSVDKNDDGESRIATHVLFCTESCIPITSLQDAAKMLAIDTTGDSLRQNVEAMDRSFLNAYDRSSEKCTRFDEYNCWDVLENVLPTNAIWKALPGWCLLSRKHAKAILDLPFRLGEIMKGTTLNNLETVDVVDLWPLFENVWAPEELYFSTALALSGYLPGPEVVMSALTHSEWNNMAKDHKERAHPRSYDGQFLTKSFLDDIRNCGDDNKSNMCLFMRKIKKEFDANLWAAIVLNDCDFPSQKRSFRSRSTIRGEKRNRNECI